MRRSHRGAGEPQAAAARVHPSRQGGEGASAKGPGDHVHLQAAAHHRAPAVLYRGSQGDGLRCLSTGLLYNMFLFFLGM